MMTNQLLLHAAGLLALVLNHCYLSSRMSHHDGTDGASDPDGREDAVSDRDTVSDPDVLTDPEFEAPPDASWLLRIGGDRYEETSSIVEARDGGIIAAGKTRSFGLGDSDIWIVKLSAAGQVIWQETVGGHDYELEAFLIECRNGELMLACQTTSFGAGNNDVLVVRLDEGGRILWQETIGGENHDYAKSILECTDGSITLAGSSNSWGAGGGGVDAFIVKLDDGGNVLWQKLLGGSAHDSAMSIVETGDGDLVFTGITHSFGAGGSDIWVVRLDAAGSVVWEKTVGTGDDDYALSIAGRSDGTLVVAGGTMAYNEYGDMLLLELDEEGTLLSQKQFGENTVDLAAWVMETSDGGLLVGGNSNFFDVIEDDMWLFRLDSEGAMAWQRTIGGPWEDSLTAVMESRYGGMIVAGEGQTSPTDPESDDWDVYDMWIARLNGFGQIPGPCGFMRDTNAAWQESDAVAADSNAALRDARAVVLEADAQVLDTDAAPVLLCPQ